MLTFTCPGCRERKKYKNFFDHVASCDKIGQDDMISNDQLNKIVQQNQNAVPVVAHHYSRLSRFIFVLEKDSKILI